MKKNGKTHQKLEQKEKKERCTQKDCPHVAFADGLCYQHIMEIVRASKRNGGALQKAEGNGDQTLNFLRKLDVLEKETLSRLDSIRLVKDLFQQRSAAAA